LLHHHDNALTHTSLKTTEFVTNNDIVIVPHPPYLLDLAPVISLCFQIESETERQCFKTVSDIQRESQMVLDSVKENGFYGAFALWKKDGITVYLPKETILKEMAAKIE
jgi:hypothetical protein